MKLTKEQAVIVSAYTGCLAAKMPDLHEYIEKIMGRPVFTHEMGNKLIAEEIRERSRADFLAICAD